jgi:hypothetical protein
MKAYEFPAKITTEGKIELPDTVLHQLPHNQQVQVIILVNEPSEDEEDLEASVDKLLDEFASHVGSHLPTLSDYAVSREGIYTVEALLEQTHSQFNSEELKDEDELEASDTWSKSDQLELTTFSLQYAASLFPKSEETTQ